MSDNCGRIPGPHYHLDTIVRIVNEDNIVSIGLKDSTGTVPEMIVFTFATPELRNEFAASLLDPYDDAQGFEVPREEF